MEKREQQLMEKERRSEAKVPGIHVQEPESDKIISPSKSSPLKNIKNNLGTFFKEKMGKSPKKEKDDASNISPKKSDADNMFGSELGQTGNTQQFA